MVQTFEGHRYDFQRFKDKQLLVSALSELRNIPDENFDLLENPFEKKLTLKQVNPLPSSELESVVIALEGEWREWASGAFGISLELDYTRHYCSVFRYLPGGYLCGHIDAGIHPIKRLRKHVTAILFIGEVDSGGALEFWGGTSANEEDDNPEILEPKMKIEPEHGKIVFFENNDYAWHGVEECSGNRPRYSITVSYLSQRIDQWHHRQRAYFSPRPGEEWDDKTYKLRDLRADSERYAEVYRV